MNHPLNRRLRMALAGGGGTGFIGRVHRTAALMDGRAELVAGAFSSNPERSREAADAFGVDPQRAYGSLEELFAREAAHPQRPDFISIALPNWLHFPVAKAALQAGFHVFCDKPMTVSSDEAFELERIARRSGLIFVLTHNYTGYPLIRHVRDLIASGELGRIRAVRVHYLQGWIRGLRPGQSLSRGAWKDDPKLNGPAGTLGDLGTHAWNLLRFVTGARPLTLSARLKCFAEGRQLDDYGSVLVEADDGALLQLTVSQVTHGRLNDLSLEVDGELGSLSWRQETPEVLSIRRTGQPLQIIERHPGAGYLSADGKMSCRLPAGHPEGFLESFANVYSAGFDAMLRYAAGQPEPDVCLYPTVRDGLEGLRFIDACLQSNAAGGAFVPFVVSD